MELPKVEAGVSPIDRRREPVEMNQGPRLFHPIDAADVWNWASTSSAAVAENAQKFANIVTSQYIFGSEAATFERGKSRYNERGGKTVRA